jgi:hypothetical protein
MLLQITYQRSQEKVNYHLPAGDSISLLALYLSLAEVWIALPCKKRDIAINFVRG